MDLANISDESLLRYYENIRSMVAADIRSGLHLVGAPARMRAEGLFAEIQRRGLSVVRIVWPDETLVSR